MVDKLNGIYFAGPGARAQMPCKDNQLIAALAGVAAPLFGVFPVDILTAERGGVHADAARAATIYVAHTTFGWTYRRVGAAIRRKHHTCVHAAMAVEARREAPAYDDLITRLEVMALAIADSFTAHTSPQPRDPRQPEMRAA